MIRRTHDCRRHTISPSAMLLSSLTRSHRFIRQHKLMSVCCLLVMIVIVMHTIDNTFQRAHLRRESIHSLHLESSTPSLRNSTVDDSLQQAANDRSHLAEQGKSGLPVNIGVLTALFDNEEESMTVAHHTSPSTSFAEHNQSSIHIQSNNKVLYNKKRQTIIMVTYVFGEDAINKRYLRLFVESARRSGIDMIAIVGPTAPSYPLPLNVQHVPLTWNELTDRVRDRIFDGKEPGTLRQTRNFYKVIDFKPLFAHLFPELVKNFDWWGYVDNDMILGNVRRILNRIKLNKYDMIASFPDEFTSGPFMLYRNTPVINELFRFAKRPLEEIFATHETRVFDEWGGGTESVRTMATADEHNHLYASTMAGIVDLNREHLGLRWFGGIMSVWDGFCRGKKEGKCTQCKLVKTSGGQEDALYEEFHGKDGMMKQRQVAFCHFEFSKKTMETSLSNDSWMHHHPSGGDWLGQGEYRINFLEGITTVDNNA